MTEEARSGEWKITSGCLSHRHWHAGYSRCPRTLSFSRQQSRESSWGTPRLLGLPWALRPPWSCHHSQLHGRVENVIAFMARPIALSFICMRLVAMAINNRFLLFLAFPFLARPLGTHVTADQKSLPGGYIPRVEKERGMLEVPWLAVELREWFASTRSTFLCYSSFYPMVHGFIR